jgi:ubiquinone/menaquinone biosynthesis C-methylase UbiE
MMDYDSSAGDYAAHRHIHPGVLRELGEAAIIGPGSAVLEVGCGTGSYISTLASRFGCLAFGLDPSAGMLAHALARPEPVSWVRGRAEALCFTASSLDLIFSVDVIHHVAEKAAFYCEAARVLRPGGRICTVTDSEEIIRRREILSGYFPETVAVELARYPSIAQLEAWQVTAGLQGCQVTTEEQPLEVKSAQPFRAKAYSSLHLISEDAWRAGLERLEHDLEKGPVVSTVRYACVWSRKPGLQVP